MSPKTEDNLGIRNQLAAFTRVLRDNGFIAGLAEARDALVILAGDAALRPAPLRAALRSLFCSRQPDWQRFDEIFDAFWLEHGMRSATRVFGTPPQAGPGRSIMPGSTPVGEGTTPDRTERGKAHEAPGGSGRRAGASTAESLERTDFRHIADPDDLLATHALAARLARAMRARLTRRERASRRGARLDLRATIHGSVARGGTMLDLVHCRRRPKPLRLALLLDASGSMNLYTTVFVRFMHGMLACFQETEVFVFHTRLVHVSPALRERDPGRAVERLALIAQGVGGGTRIGESLATFDRWHAKRALRGRSALDHRLGRLRHRPARDAWAGDGVAAPPLPADRLAQPDAGLGGLRAGSPRHGGGAAVRGLVRTGAQFGELGRLGTLSGENLGLRRVSGP